MTETRRRGGGRQGRQSRKGRDRQAGYRRLVNPYEPARILTDDQIAAIHQAALRLLAEVGMRVMLEEARQILAAHDVDVDDDTELVRFDPEMVAEAIESCPSQFEIISNSGERDVVMGGDSVAMLPVAGPPHAMDLERGRRAGTLENFDDFVRLTQSFDVLHGLTPMVEPQDVDLEFRHLQMSRSQLLLSDKIPFAYARGRAQVADCLEMFRIASGADVSGFAASPRCWTVINTNSPRQIDLPMCEGIIDFARSGQVLLITPFTLAGAMAPVSLAGALTQQHAEALGAIALAQLVNPGTPVLYGAFTSNVDMRSGAPAFGTPEAFKAAIASGQLARHLGIPWRSSGVSTSNTPDAQGGYETMMNMFGALLGGAHMIVHAAGWVESGLSASYEKFILDVDMLQMIAESFRAIDTSPAELAVEAISGVEPGGHFFGTDHTLERFRDAFYEPMTFARSNFEQWTEGGSLTALQRAHPVWKKVLADFEPPAVDDEIVAELEDFVGRRTAQGGALPRT